ncbi:hypothetical protein MNBD_GAMMA25-2346 [hydrothermal vent metagenome]|uniref:Uncharacterized protein n=1 Tax=hydrothermal vent metagenome TaxID=652676 RepID=A0A3B1BYC1_9ZZZZ
MHRLFKLLTLPALIFGVSLSGVPISTAQAETLTMPEQADPGMETYSIDLPGRGMSMVEVEKRFGPAGKKEDEVGDPPITRWIYEDFIVYFEYQFVIHAVASQRAP